MATARVSAMKVLLVVVVDVLGVKSIGHDGPMPRIDQADEVWQPAFRHSPREFHMQSRPTSFLLTLLALSAFACSPARNGAGAGDLPTARVAEPGVIDGAAMLEQHANLFPHDTVLFAVANFGYVLRTMVVNGMGMMPEEWDSAPLLRDLSKFSQERIGLDITKVETVMVAVTDSKNLVVLVDGDLGSPAPSARSGMRLMPTNHPSVWALAFDDEQLTAMQDVLLGRVRTLADGPNHDRMSQVLRKAGAGLITVGIQVRDGKVSQGVTQALPLVPRAAALSISDTVDLIVNGDADTLDAIRKMIEAGLAALKAKMHKELMEVEHADFADGLFAIIGYHMVDGATVALTPTIEGEFMSISIDWPEMGGVMPLVGTSAAIAIPVFLSYLARTPSVGMMEASGILGDPVEANLTDD